MFSVRCILSCHRIVNPLDKPLWALHKIRLAKNRGQIVFRIKIESLHEIRLFIE